MSIEEVIDFLEENNGVTEYYVLVREITLYLDLEHEYYTPRVQIKIWKTGGTTDYPYHFTVSHHAHTPTQFSPYHPSRTSAESEEAAIREAISTTTTFLRSAIQAGHEPHDSWLVANENY